MIEYHRNVRYKLWMVLVITCVLLLLLLIGCDDESSPTTPGTDDQVEIEGLPADPGAGNLAGKIIGTISKQPIAGVRVSVDPHSGMTDSEGLFRLNNVGEGNLAVVISGEQIYTRTASVDTTNGRSVRIDVIEKEGDFNLDFYRELARGNHPEENELQPIHRWTSSTPPTFYIDTNPESTDDGVVTQGTIDTTRHVITQVLPVFSGKVYETASIQVRSFSERNFDAIPDNSIVISYDDTLYRRGVLGVTFTEPELTSSTNFSIRKAWIFVLQREEYYIAGNTSRERMIAHELGHGFGYRHTSVLPSVMMKESGTFNELFSEHDRLHMAIVYSRPAGNVDVDNDPLPGRTTISRISNRQVFIDQITDFSLPEEENHRLHSPGNQ